MPRLDSFLSKVIKAGRKKRFTYSKSIPLKLLLLLIAAAFFIFAGFGLRSSLIGDTSPHPENGLAWALLSGIMAMVWLLVFSRKPILIPVAVAGQIAISTALAHILVWIDGFQRAAPIRVVVQVYAPLTVGCTVVAYALFCQRR